MERRVFEKIVSVVKADPSKVECWQDLLAFLRNALAENRNDGLALAKDVKRLIRSIVDKGELLVEMSQYGFEVLKLCSPYSLDDYFQALEYGRNTKDKFYLPRRQKLLPIVRDLEKLLITDELDEMFLSSPPRIGKTTLCLFVVSWLVGVQSEKSNLYVSCSGQLCNAFYKGVSELLTDEFTYCWQNIFPNVKFDKGSMCNAKETYLDTKRIKRYHSLTCRSIDADGLNGACDCNGLLIADDLCSGIEEALNPNRMVSLWSKVNNNMITRAKMGAKILWIGTRWSKSDPIGVRMNMLLTESEFKNRRVKIVNLPALDENDESNFDYLYNVGFDTAYYKERRKSFETTDDLASWLAQYMGEPVERSGLLFPQSSLKYYNGELPKDKTPDRIFAPVDVAWGGGDYLSMPVFYQYGTDVYIHDWVFDKGDKFITRPKVISAVLRNNIQAMRFEKNNGGDEYKEDIEVELLTKHNYKLNITSKSASTKQAKETRIFDKAPEIKNFYFLEPSKRNSDYRKAMENLCSYVILGKNRNDDAPDSLSQGCDMMVIKATGPTFEIFTRPF